MGWVSFASGVVLGVVLGAAVGAGAFYAYMVWGFIGGGPGGAK